MEGEKVTTNLTNKLTYEPWRHLKDGSKGEKERGQSSFGEVTPAGQVAIVVEDEKRVGDQVTRDTGQLESVNNFCKIMSLDKEP